MKLQNKNYKYYKIKKYVKNSNLILIFNGTNIKNFIKMNQKLKSVNLHFYKTYNTLMKKSLKKSIYKNFQSLINNLTVIIKPSTKNTDLTLDNFFELDEDFYLIGLKINVKFYATSKLNSLLQLNYKNDHLLLLKFLKTRLKVSYKLT